MAFIPHSPKIEPTRYVEVGKIDDYYDSVDQYDPDDQVNMTDVRQSSVAIAKGLDKTFKDTWLVMLDEYLFTPDDLRELMKEIERKIIENS